MPEIKAAPVEQKYQMYYTTAELLAIISVGAEPPFRVIDDKNLIAVWDDEEKAYLNPNGARIRCDLSREHLDHKWQLVNPTKEHFLKHSNRKEER